MQNPSKSKPASTRKRLRHRLRERLRSCAGQRSLRAGIHATLGSRTPATTRGLLRWLQRLRGRVRLCCADRRWIVKTAAPRVRRRPLSSASRTPQTARRARP